LYALVNRTGCQAHAQLLFDAHGEEHLLIVVKASFAVGPQRLEPVPGAEIVVADRYHGDPTTTSLAAASELALAKPQPDLLLSGQAYPDRPGDSSGVVSFRLGTWSKEVRVVGDRVWRPGVTGLRPGAPKPFDAIPLIYERAFGGADLQRTPPIGCEENPVGVGLVDCRAGAPLPNLEDMRHRLDAPGGRPPPRAFGPIPPHWQPRRGLSGTFDAAWQRTRLPLPPLDADPRANQVAPPDQVYPGPLCGGEAVEIRGVRPGGAPLAFRLPVVQLRVTAYGRTGRRELATVLDTLYVDAEAAGLDLTWRASMSVHERLDELDMVVIDSLGGPHG
jgi:hypothetical protein